MGTNGIRKKVERRQNIKICEWILEMHFWSVISSLFQLSKTVIIIIKLSNNNK